MAAVAGVRVPVILCIDCEPDGPVVRHPLPWRGLELWIDESRRLRDDLERVTGVPTRFSWFLRMDPQIEAVYGASTWVVDNFPFLATLRDAGDVIGVHPHAWRWHRSDDAWHEDWSDPAWVSRCVEVACHAYSESFGEGARHHRFGDRFMSTALMNQLRRLDVQFDLTLEPREGLPDPSRTPYRPDEEDFCRASTGDEDALWAIPLSVGRHVPPTPLRLGVRGLVRHPRNTTKKLARRVYERGRLWTSGDKESHRLLAMWDEWRSGADFWDSAFATTGELEAPHLSFAIRSNTLTDPILRDRFNEIMQQLLKDPRASALVFTTPDDALRRLGLLKPASHAGG